MQFTEEQAAEVKIWVVKRLEDMYDCCRLSPLDKIALT